MIPIPRDDEAAWREFIDAGLLWFVNRLLHLWGWVIVVHTIEANGDITGVSVARVNYRGFSRIDEESGYERLTEYMAKESPKLLQDFADQG